MSNSTGQEKEYTNMMYTIKEGSYGRYEAVGVVREKYKSQFLSKLYPEATQFHATGKAR
jgi:hypothetical protein